MKPEPRSLRIALWIFAGVLVILTAIAMTIPASPSTQSATAGAMIQSSTPTAQVDSEIGSTDGVVFIASIIVVIIILPILLRWKDWSNSSKQT